MQVLFNQYVPEPTRGNNILNLALSNNEQLVNHNLSTPTVLSDQNILDITLNYSQKRVNTTNHFEETIKAPSQNPTPAMLIRTNWTKH